MAEMFVSDGVSASEPPQGGPVVVVVDDDESVRETLEDLFRSVGLGVVSNS
jgi:FixJ family two-component response regulator